MRLILAFLPAAILSCSSGPVPNLRSTDPYERYLGALEIADSDRPNDVEKIVTLLKDPDPLARTGAVVALEQGRPDGALPLLAGMLADPDAGVRAEAARSVAAFRDPSTIPAIVNLLARDGSVETRRVAARVLGGFPDGPEIRSALLEALSDPAAEVAFNAYRSLVHVTRRTDLPRARAAAEEALKRS